MNVNGRCVERLADNANVETEYDNLDFDINSQPNNLSIQESSYVNQCTLWLGKGEATVNTIKSFYNLKKNTGLSTNKDMLQWLVKVGEIAVKELENKNKNAILTYVNSNTIDPGITVPYLGSTSLKHEKTYSTARNEFTFIPFKPEMNQNSKIVPTLFVMKTNDDNTSVNHKPMPEVILDPYKDLSTDELIYQKYIKYLEVDYQKSSIRKVDKVASKKRRKSSCLDKKVNEEEDEDNTSPIVSNQQKESKLLDDCTLSQVKSAKHRKGKCSSTKTQEELESMLKKSVYILGNREQNVVYEAHSDVVQSENGYKGLLDFNEGSSSNRNDEMEWVKIIKSTIPHEHHNL